MNELVLLIGIALLIHFIFLLGWLIAIRVDNYSLVDLLWAASIGLSGLLLALFQSGTASKRSVAGLLALCWGGRLAYHLYQRIRHHHPQEDSRYQKLRELWQGKIKSSFFYFFQAQALLVILLSLPYFLITRDSSDWGLIESIGLSISLIGLAGETLADQQMVRFKNTREQKHLICRQGLWKYSRHPNYFFEALFWLGLSLLACAATWGWLSLSAPLLITFLLLKVTGIPPSEASSLKHKGEAYRDYQKTTSAFIPLPPKSS